MFNLPEDYSFGDLPDDYPWLKKRLAKGASIGDGLVGEIKLENRYIALTTEHAYAQLAEQVGNQELGKEYRKSMKSREKSTAKKIVENNISQKRELIFDLIETPAEAKEREEKERFDSQEMPEQKSDVVMPTPAEEHAQIKGKRNTRRQKNLKYKPSEEE